MPPAPALARLPSFMRAEFDSPPRPRCNFCHDVIGVYEPVVWLDAGLVRVTSRAAEPQLSAPERRGSLYHRACYDALAATGEGSGVRLVS